MTRDANTPLILWICAAVCAHIVFAEGGGVVARIHDDKSYLARMAAVVRDRVRHDEQTFELSGFEAGSKSDVPQEPLPPPPPPPPPKPEKTVEPPKEQPKPPAPPKKAEPKKEEKKIPLVIKEETKPLPPPPPQIDKRIAVRQHAKPDQEDNPDARFVGDQANKVEQETVATQTSHDRDDENPTPGGNHAGPQDHVGDSERTKIAESEDHDGEKNRAPGEKGTEFQVQPLPMAKTPMGPVAVQGPKTPQAPSAGGDGRTASSSALNPPPQMAPGNPAPPSPSVNDSNDGTWTFNPTRPNTGTGQAPDPGQGQASKAPLAPRPGTTTTTWLGLGGRPGPGQVNLNLSQQGVVAAVGQDQLRKEREADGERRRSEHRGSWIASNFERWRSAIENYVSTVKPGNQTALNTAQVPFASYLNGMHNRIHPIFADNFLGSLDGLPREHPLNNPKLITRLEIVVTRDGHLLKMGIVRTSGITAFDIAALDSVNRAQPFGPAPSAIVSPDGNVYLHWEFHRDEVYACSTMNARPFLLNVPAPGNGPPEPQPPGTPPSKSPTQERGVPPANTNETREGLLLPEVSPSRPVASRKAS
jgi:TonB family protein